MICVWYLHFSLLSTTRQPWDSGPDSILTNTQCQPFAHDSTIISLWSDAFLVERKKRWQTIQQCSELSGKPYDHKSRLLNAAGSGAAPTCSISVFIESSYMLPGSSGYGSDLNMSQSKRNCTCWQPKHPKSLLPRRYFHMIPRLPRAPHFSAWINSGNMMQNKQATLTQFGACAGRLHILARLAPQAKPKWVASGIGLISVSSVLGLISPDPCLFASGLIWVRSWHFSKQSATRTDHGPLMSTISLYGCQYMSIHVNTESILSQYWVNTL